MLDVNVKQGKVMQLTDYKRRINIICVLKNRGAQLIRFVKNLGEEIRATGGVNYILSIYDFGSDDLDVRDTLVKSRLLFNLIKGEGTFSKASPL